MSNDVYDHNNLKAIIDNGYINMDERRRCESKSRLDGKVVVITGANTGIGKETALQLSLKGAKVYIGCRDMKRAIDAIDDIKKTNPNADITALTLDLSSFKSVREFVKKLSARESVVDILINNAGISSCPEWKTVDGFEMQIQVNYLSQFLFTLLLLPLLKKSKKARVINVSGGIYALSKLHLDNINMTGIYSPSGAYAHSKLAHILFTRELARRLGPNSNVNCYVLHPGSVETELIRHVPEEIVEQRYKNFPIKRISVELGAQTTLYCALDESLDNESGHYYDNCKRLDKLTDEAKNDDLAKKTMG